MILRTGTALLSMGLILLGLGALFLPEFSSEGYGVPSVDGTWVGATGLRDLALGLMTLILLLRQPSALRLFLPPLLVLPLGDIVLVLLAGKPLVNTAPHVMGTLAIGALSVLAWKEAKRTTAPASE